VQVPDAPSEYPAAPLPESVPKVLPNLIASPLAVTVIVPQLTEVPMALFGQVVLEPAVNTAVPVATVPEALIVALVPESLRAIVKVAGIVPGILVVGAKLMTPVVQV
jgi:hypothetical protein